MNSKRFFSPVACLALISSFSGANAAILFEDNFDTGPIDTGKWDTSTLNPGNVNGEFDTTADGVLGLVTPGTVSGVRPEARMTALTTVDRMTSWTMTVTMNLAALADLSSTFAPGDGVAMTVQVRNGIDNEDRLEVNFAAINFGSPGYAVRSAERLSASGSGNEPILPQAGNTASTATLVVTYDHLTQMTSSAYQFNGGPLTRFDFDTDIGDWSTGAGDDFNFQVEASAGNFAGGSAPLAGDMDFSAGEVAFDSISITDEATTLPPVVPEPTAPLTAALTAILWCCRRNR